MLQWNQIYMNGITLSNTAKIKSLIFAEDQVIKDDAEDY